MIEEFHTIRIGITKLAYSVSQPSDTSKSRLSPLLFLHGNPGSKGDFRRVIEIVGRSRPTICPDRPGYGASRPAAPEDIGIFANARVVASLLNHLDHDRVVAVGHSYGGGVAIALALQYPERVTGLVLLASVGAPAALLLSDHIASLPVVGEAIAFLSLGTGGRFAPKLIARLAAAIAPGAPALEYERILREAGPANEIWRTYLSEQRALIEETPELSMRLGELSVPTLILTGDNDQTVPIKAASELARAVNGSRIEVLAQTGHVLPHERPEEVAHLILDLAET